MFRCDHENTLRRVDILLERKLERRIYDYLAVMEEEEWSFV